DESEIEGITARMTFAATLARLNARCREILRRRYLQDESTTTIADGMRMTTAHLSPTPTARTPHRAIPAPVLPRTYGRAYARTCAIHGARPQHADAYGKAVPRRDAAGSTARAADRRSIPSPTR